MLRRIACFCDVRCPWEDPILRLEGQKKSLHTSYRTIRAGGGRTKLRELNKGPVESHTYSYNEVGNTGPIFSQTNGTILPDRYSWGD